MIPRTLSHVLEKRAASYPVVFLTGPRQSGKTTLARTTFPDFDYVSLEELTSRHEAADDPRGFLRRLEGARGAVLDEVQHVPDLFSYVQGFADERRGGPLILTGSQQCLLSERISQSLAGRVATLELLPFSIAELVRRPAARADDLLTREPASAERPSLELNEILCTGFFPPIHDRSLDPGPWLDAYVRTYVERDVRTLANVGDLDAFTRFVGLCAGRVGNLLNLSSLGNDAGLTHPTVKRWISILRASYVIALVQPHSRNFSKRLIKSPKLYFLDTGLLCYLLGIRRADDLRTHPLRGAIFENLIFAELEKSLLHHGERAQLFFWRDVRGNEVDILLDLGTVRVPIEVKAGETVPPDAFRNLDYYLGLSRDPGGILVHGGEGWYRHREHSVRPWWAVS